MLSAPAILIAVEPRTDAHPSRFSIWTGSSSQAGAKGSMSWASLRATPMDHGNATAPWTASTMTSIEGPTVSRNAVM